jgi:hypothetical protein
MKERLLLLALCCWSVATSAQATNCAALTTENAALKDKIVAYESRLGIGVGGVTVRDGDDALKFKFISCKVSKATHKGNLVVQASNSGEPVQLVLSGAGSTNIASTHSTLVVDEQGQAYKSEDFNPVVGGKADGANVIPPNVPINCTVYLVGIPTVATRLNSATLAFTKASSNKERQLLKTTIKNIPVTWVP